MVFCSFVRLSKPPSRQQILAMQDAGTSASQRKEEPAVQKTILTALAATLIAASTAQIASASEHRRAHKVTHAPVAEQFRNANNAIAQPYWPYSG
jgi:ribosomal protein S7